MTRIYHPGIRGYTNITTGACRFFVLTGAYLIFKPKEEVKDYQIPMKTSWKTSKLPFLPFLLKA